LMKVLTDFPSVVVTALNSLSVESVCNLSLAKACQVARSNNSVLSNVFSLCVGSKPSKTGRAHCMCVKSFHIEYVESSGVPEEDLRSLLQLAFASLMGFL
jgi:hypothetical protein